MNRSWYFKIYLYDDQVLDNITQIEKKTKPVFFTRYESNHLKQTLQPCSHWFCVKFHAQVVFLGFFTSNFMYIQSILQRKQNGEIDTAPLTSADDWRNFPLVPSWVWYIVGTVIIHRIIILKKVHFKKSGIVPIF